MTPVSWFAGECHPCFAEKIQFYQGESQEDTPILLSLAPASNALVLHQDPALQLAVKGEDSLRLGLGLAGVSPDWDPPEGTDQPLPIHCTALPTGSPQLSAAQHQEIALISVTQFWNTHSRLFMSTSPQYLAHLAQGKSVPFQGCIFLLLLFPLSVLLWQQVSLPPFLLLSISMSVIAEDGTQSDHWPILQCLSYKRGWMISKSST